MYWNPTYMRRSENHIPEKFKDRKTKRGVYAILNYGMGQGPEASKDRRIIHRMIRRTADVW